MITELSNEQLVTEILKKNSMLKSNIETGISTEEWADLGNFLNNLPPEKFKTNFVSNGKYKFINLNSGWDMSFN